MSYILFSKQYENETVQLSLFLMTCTNAAKWSTYLIIQKIFNNYSLKPNGLWVNSYWLRGHERPWEAKEAPLTIKWFPGRSCIRSKWNLEMLIFEERGKPENLEKNLSEQSKEPTTNLTHSWPEPGPCWWEASVITTTPSLLSVSDTRHIKFSLITQQMCQLNMVSKIGILSQTG